MASRAAAAGALLLMLAPPPVAAEVIHRVCPGAGFAMIEGPLLLSRLLRDFRVVADPNRVPRPVAHLTVRAQNGIWLRLERR